MGKENIFDSLKELFPDIAEEKLINLVNSGDDINILITRILDENIDPPNINLKDLALVKNSTFSNSTFSIEYEKEYNYPEIFEKRNSYIYNEKEYYEYRRLASLIYSEAYNLPTCGQKSRRALNHYLIKSDNIRKEAEMYDKKAALLLISRELNSGVRKDLHGFKLKEAIMFMDDYYKFKKFKYIEIITGQIKMNSKIRPAIQDWFIKNGFSYGDVGPIITGTKPSL